MKILANDGVSKSGIAALEKEGFEVLTTTVAQEQLVNFINENEIIGLLVRSATKVRTDIIDNCPSLKLIGRGGVGMDNIDVTYAREKGLHVINTPAASSESVAELVFCTSLWRRSFFIRCQSKYAFRRRHQIQGTQKNVCRGY